MEFGPLISPILTDRKRVRYVDHCDENDLFRKHGAGDEDYRKKIAPVDIIWAGGDAGGVFDDWCPVDLIVASHVIEHVPNIVYWLQIIAGCLSQGGVLSLAIPDKRQTFDYFRHTSTIGEILEAYFQKYDRPTLRAVIDHRRYAVRRNGKNSWIEETKPEELDFVFNDSKIIKTFLDKWRGGEYIDTHCWVFTPDSFVGMIDLLRDIDLVKLKILAPPVEFGHEFVVHLSNA